MSTQGDMGSHQLKVQIGVEAEGDLVKPFIFLKRLDFVMITWYIIRELESVIKERKYGTYGRNNECNW